MAEYLKACGFSGYYLALYLYIWVHEQEEVIKQ
jgi:hypothetical protein